MKSDPAHTPLPHCTARLLLTALLFLSVPASSQTNHKIASGETLDSIGKQYDVTVRDLIRYNDLANPDRIMPGDTLKIPPRPGDVIPYTVKRGDTLGEIANAHGTSIDAITATNHIANPDSLTVGQTLLVPVERIPVPQQKYPLPAALEKRLDATPVRAGRWQYIVIHHSATKSGTIKGLDEYHRKRRHMVNGLAYHFVIGNGNGIPNGKIEIGDRWKKQIRGGHLASETQNQVAIGICLIGNFENAHPTKAQMDSLYALVTYLQKRAGIPTDKVKTHTMINEKPTKCPGRHFPTRTFRNNL